MRDNIDLVGMAQLSDYVIGTTETGNRVVPGDGDIPLERLVAMALDAGFEGMFDLEVMGPRIEEEGYPSAVRTRWNGPASSSTDSAPDSRTGATDQEAERVPSSWWVAGG